MVVFNSKVLASCAILAVALALTAASGPASAQEGPGTDARQAQQQAFEALRAAPDDVDLMFAHVRASLAVNDYESAIGTLERILIYRPDLARVRVELGAAHFRLGAYSVAQFYFDEALASGRLTPDEEAQIRRYLAQIETRQAEFAFAGSAMVGIVVSSNANLGTSSELVSVSGAAVPAPDVIREASDVGMRVVLNLSHQYDLDQPDGDYWRTDAQAYAVQYLNEDQGNVNVFVLRTGPRLSLTPLSYGPKLRPFAEVELYRADDQSLFRGLGAGLEFTDTLTPDWSVFAVGRLQHRDFFDSQQELDGLYSRTAVGFVHTYTPFLSLRGSVLFDYVETDLDFNDYLQIGARGEFDYRYDPGFDWADRDWRAGGYAAFGRRIFGQGNPRVAPGVHRRDSIFRVGVSNTAFLQEGFFTRLELDYIQRASNISNFELDGVSLALSVGRTF